MRSPFAPVQSFTPIPETAAGAQVIAFGGYQPGNVVTNDDLAAMVDTSDEWIRGRVGIVSRRVAGPDETVDDMAVAAGGKALAGSGLCPDDIDLVIVATCSTESPLPNSAASVVAHRLGIGAPGAYDVNAACSKLLLRPGRGIRRGQERYTARYALVIGAEKMSARLDRPGRTGQPPSSSPMARARPWSARSTTTSLRHRTGGVGQRGRHGGADHDSGRTEFLRQDGQAVFRWATTAMHTDRRGGMQAGRGRGEQDLSAFVPHQANLRIIEAIARRVGVPRERVADDIIESGNTSSASIPLALARMTERGENSIRFARPCCCSEFGAGLCYAAQVITVP